MIKNIFCSIFVFMTIFITIGCDILNNMVNVEVLLPELPDWWLDNYSENGAILFYYNQNGGLTTLSIDGQRQYVTLSISRRVNQSILYYPLLPQPLATRARPAAAVYPYNTDQQGRILLNWNDGAAGEILFNLYRSQWQLGSFNGNRLLKKLRAMPVEERYIIDKTSITAKIAAGRLTGNDFKKNRLHKISVLLRPGKWLWDDFLMPEILVNEESSKIDLELPAGSYHLFAVDGSMMAALLIDFYGNLTVTEYPKTLSDH